MAGVHSSNEWLACLAGRWVLFLILGSRGRRGRHGSRGRSRRRGRRHSRGGDRGCSQQGLVGVALKSTPLPVALAVEAKHVVMVVHQLRTMAHGKDRDTESLAVLVDLALDVHAHGARALILIQQ